MWQSFRKNYNNELKSVCSHGDWINRTLSFVNQDFIDLNKLGEIGISFEAYNSKILNTFFKLSDGEYSADNWCYSDKYDQNVYALTHESSWYPGVVANTLENFSRLFETLNNKFLTWNEKFCTDRCGGIRRSTSS